MTTTMFLLSKAHLKKFLSVLLLSLWLSTITNCIGIGHPKKRAIVQHCTNILISVFCLSLFSESNKCPLTYPGSPPILSTHPLRESTNFKLKTTVGIQQSIPFSSCHEWKEWQFSKMPPCSPCAIAIGWFKWKIYDFFGASMDKEAFPNTCSDKEDLMIWYESLKGTAGWGPELG